MASGAGIVAFEDPRLGSTATELDELDDSAFSGVLGHFTEVVRGRVDYRRLKEFDRFGGAPLFKAEFADMIAIYSVEEDESGDRKVTVMFAGRRHAPFAAGSLRWDGENDEALRRGVIRARAAVWFK